MTAVNQSSNSDNKWLKSDSLLIGMTSKAELVQNPNYLKKVVVCLQVSDNVKASYNIKHVTGDTKIRKFKTDSELATGIPVCLQRLHYLDNGTFTVVYLATALFYLSFL